MKCVQSLFVFFFAGFLASSAFALDIYVETNYENQPDLRPYGVKKLGLDPLRSGMIYEGNLWSDGEEKDLLPSESRVTNYVNGKFGDYNGLLVIDLETWPIKNLSDELFDYYMNNYLTLLGWVQSAAPFANVGYYAKPPISNPSAAQQDEDEKLYTDWQAKNDRIAPLADAVDAFFPSLYATNDSRSHWINYAAAMMKETRRYGTGKRIYPFLNPEYHSSAPNGLAFDLIPEDFFLLQLQTLEQENVDGVIIWGWGSQNTPWDEDLPWWRATLEFLGSQ